ncbi:E3 ubiquitin-protein ligase AMFR-like [Oscarella lobularis]|uniref:E3 ubiquitin-protein ligase AMFR-like n=1 Tax=Oscarella lobularis TaxID=121494 RepID=UPI0033134D77
MPLASTRSFPLPSLKVYTAISVLILIVALITARQLSATNPNVEEANATQNDDNNATTSSSTFPKWPAINMAYCLLLLLGTLAQKAVFGELRVGEQQMVKEKTMNYIFHKFVFLFGVLNIEEFEELLTWITWLALVGFFAIWVSMTKMRSEYVCQSPHTAKLTHFKFIGVLAVILVSSAALFSIALSMEPIETDYGIDYLVFMGAECLLLGLRALHAIAKHCIHVYDEARLGTWENQAVVSYYTDLVGEMAILGVDFVHRLHMMIWANVFLSMASLVIFMQLRTLYAEMRKRIDKHRNFVRVSQSLDTRFPLATKEQLEGNDDNCAICWDKMENARLLPCNHLFHLSCLRSWLEQDRSCPTCRVNLGETQETPSNEANWQPAVETPRNMDLSPFVRNRGERRRNNLFRFDGRQLASWLPIFSVQVVQEGRQRPVTQMERMARAVQDVLPDYPMDLIMSDLAQTRSADQTVQNLLERSPFQESALSREPTGSSSLRLRRPATPPSNSTVSQSEDPVVQSTEEPTETADRSAAEDDEGGGGIGPLPHYQAEVVLPSELVDSDVRNGSSEYRKQ